MNEERTPGRQGGAPDAGIRRALLEAVHRHAQRGETYLAVERYLKLMREHPGTLEGHEARQALLDIAQRYEAEGKRYHALSLYDKVAASLTVPKPRGSNEASRRTHETKMAEIPFVDLTEDVHIAQNFERLGRVHRVRTGILHQTVDALAKLKE